MRAGAVLWVATAAALVGVAGLDVAGRDALRERCRELLPPAPFATDATAWTVLARV